MHRLSSFHRSQIIKTKAKELGFDSCGISKADFLEEEAKHLETWLKQNAHGEMSYMENYFDKRTDPRKLVEGAKSIISLSLNYYNPEKQEDSEAPKISMYAYGKDYHDVIKDKLKRLVADLKSEIGDFQERHFTDSAPVMDKAWAKRSGIGWMGKNTNIIHPKAGSYFFLAEIICDLDLEYDNAMKDYCGTCTQCIDACPTGAIIKPYVVDGSKCISYFTIELKDQMPIPDEFKGKMDHWMFGCDVCQEVCPWNRFSKPHQTEEFTPTFSLLNMTKDNWQMLKEEEFNSLFKHSAVKRTKYKGLKRNIDFLGF